jgi:hypothetical protein
MEIPQIFQGINNYYTIPWQKTKKNILNLKRGGDNCRFFWLYYLKRGGEY